MAMTTMHKNVNQGAGKDHQERKSRRNMRTMPNRKINGYDNCGSEYQSTAIRCEAFEHGSISHGRTIAQIFA
jgi:hypothetical protein